MDSGISVGVIAGVSVAACVLILAIVLVVIYCYVKLRNNVKTVKHVEDGKADSSWSTKASSNYTASTHDRSEASRVTNASNARNDHRGPDSSQEISSISSADSVFGYNNVSFNPNADDKDRKKKVAFHSKHVYNNDAFDSTGTGDSSFEKIKYKKRESRNGSLSREARSGSSRKSRQRNSSVDKDSVDSRRRTTSDGRQSRSVDRDKERSDRDRSERDRSERDRSERDRSDRDRSDRERSDRERKPSNGQSSTSSIQRTAHSGTRSSGRSRSRSSGRRSSGRSGSHSRRNYARSASSDTSRRSSHKSSLPPEQRPSITAMYANRGFRDDDDRTPSPEERDQVDQQAPRPESQV